MWVKVSLVSAALSACAAASSEETQTPSGKPGFEVTCVKASDGACNEEASRRCPSGFTTEKQDEYWRQNAGAGTGGQTMMRWIIACK